MEKAPGPLNKITDVLDQKIRVELKKDAYFK